MINLDMKLRWWYIAMWKNPYMVFSPVDITEKRGEPGKNSKKAEFGIIRKQIFVE